MASAQTSFDRAEAACVAFLARVLGMGAADLVTDDYLEPDVVGKAAFCLSGGPEQTQNFGVSAPAGAWYAFGNFLAQYETRPEAVAALGKVQNNTPARRADRSPGLVPNVRNFELLEHPALESRLVVDGETGAVIGRIWTLRARFRVVYCNTAT